jgi:hypothetical protein
VYAWVGLGRQVSATFWFPNLVGGMTATSVDSSLEGGFIVLYVKTAQVLPWGFARC